MNERILEFARQTGLCDADGDFFGGKIRQYEEFAQLIVRECAKELREAEQEADRAYKTKEVKERNTFDGYDFADMLEERFGVE